MSKMNELSVDYDAIEAHEESERQKLRDEGIAEYKNELLQKLDVELSWKNTHEAFRAGIEWVKDQILENGRI
jgi:hypothetical protein